MRIAGLLGMAFLGACAAGAVDWTTVPLQESVYFHGESLDSLDIEEATDLNHGATIELAAGDSLEYMLGMSRADSIEFAWRAEGVEQDSNLLVEFHGHTIVDENNSGEVMFFDQRRGSESAGVLTAPFTGEHGWYISNEGETPISVSLNIRGVFTLNES